MPGSDACPFRRVSSLFLSRPVTSTLPGHRVRVLFGRRQSVSRLWCPVNFFASRRRPGYWCEGSSRNDDDRDWVEGSVPLPWCAPPPEEWLVQGSRLLRWLSYVVRSLPRGSQVCPSKVRGEASGSLWKTLMEGSLLLVEVLPEGGTSGSYCERLMENRDCDLGSRTSLSSLTETTTDRSSYIVVLDWFCMKIFKRGLSSRQEILRPFFQPKSLYYQSPFTRFYMLHNG